MLYVWGMVRDAEDFKFFTGAALQPVYIVEPNAQGTIDIFVKMIKSGVERKFTRFQFLEMLMHARYLEIDAAAELTEKVRKSFEAKREVIHYNLHFRQEAYEAKLAGFDYSDYIAEMDSTISNLKAQLEIEEYKVQVRRNEMDFKKYELELQKYNLEVEKLGYDKEISRRIFKTYWLNFAFSAGAFAVSMALLILKLIELTSKQK